jgi:hypothetical protein
MRNIIGFICGLIFAFIAMFCLIALFVGRVGSWCKANLFKVIGKYVPAICSCTGMVVSIIIGNKLSALWAACCLMTDALLLSNEGIKEGQQQLISTLYGVISEKNYLLQQRMAEGISQGRSEGIDKARQMMADFIGPLAADLMWTAMLNKQVEIAKGNEAAAGGSPELKAQ